eukprot:6159478-Amphidinium_carterae.1
MGRCAGFQSHACFRCVVPCGDEEMVADPAVDGIAAEGEREEQGEGEEPPEQPGQEAAKQWGRCASNASLVAKSEGESEAMLAPIKTNFQRRERKKTKSLKHLE